MVNRPAVTTCISIDIQDLEKLDHLYLACKDKGYTAATKSDVIRYMVRQFTADDIPPAEGRSKLT